MDDRDRRKPVSSFIGLSAEHGAGGLDPVAGGHELEPQSVVRSHDTPVGPGAALVLDCDERPQFVLDAGIGLEVQLEAGGRLAPRELRTSPDCAPARGLGGQVVRAQRAGDRELELRCYFRFRLRPAVPPPPGRPPRVCCCRRSACLRIWRFAVSGTPPCSWAASM